MSSTNTTNLGKSEIRLKIELLGRLAIWFIQVRDSVGRTEVDKIMPPCLTRMDNE